MQKMRNWHISRRVLALASVPTLALTSLGMGVPNTVDAAGPLYNFTIDNLGTANTALGNVAHFSVSNIGVNGDPTDSVVLVPASEVTTLTTAQQARLQAVAAAGGTVLVWQNGSVTINSSSVDSLLGVASPPVSPKVTQANLDNIYAAGITKGSHGQWEYLTFVNSSPLTTSAQLTRAESGMWSLLNNLKASQSAGGPVKGPQANGQDPSYTAKTLYTFGTNGEVQVTDNLTMQRVNNDTLSVWTDKASWMIMPGSQLYSDGQTSFNGDVNSHNVLVSYSDASGEDVTASGPNDTNTNSTATVSLSTNNIGVSWSFPTNQSVWTNESDTNVAKENVAISPYSNTSETTYDPLPGWQMTNTYGDFVYTRTISASWMNWWTGIYSTTTTYSNDIVEPDWG